MSHCNTVVTKLGRALADFLQLTDHGVRRVRVEEAEARRVRVDTERADIESQIAAESENLAHARDALRVAEAALEGLGERRPQLLTQRDEAAEQVQGARSHARDERDALYALDTRWQTLESRHAASVAARERLIKQRDALAAQKQALTASIGDTRTPLPDLQARLETKLSQRADVESRQAELRVELETIDANVRALEQQRSEAAATVDTVRGNLERVRVSFEGLSVQEKTLTEQISRTEFTLATLLEEMPEDASERAWEEELEKLDRRIQRLGAINLAAIEEYDQQSERKVYLDQQNADLEAALETLTTAIRKIDKETRSRFKDTFERVNQQLGELFPKVFGGGSARLELTGEDLLDTGVTLMARPPGKRNSEHPSVVRGREGDDGRGADLCHLSSEPESGVFAGRGGCAFGRHQCRSFRRTHPRDVGRRPVCRDNAQQDHDGDGRSSDGGHDERARCLATGYGGCRGSGGDGRGVAQTVTTVSLLE